MNPKVNFFGTEMSQMENAPIVLNNFLNFARPETIIEIGTFKGGLSVLFALYAVSNKKNFVTYDIKDHVVNTDVFLNLNIKRRIVDVFSDDAIQEISALIKQKGTTVVFCDGGNKIREFKIFSDFLKQGDFILAHDFSESKEYFDANVKNKLWNWCEITDLDIQKKCDENKLQKSFLELENAVITCRQKR